MKKVYEAPELELVRLSLRNVLTSSIEATIGENIDPGNPNDPIVLDGIGED